MKQIQTAPLHLGLTLALCLGGLTGCPEQREGNWGAPATTAASKTAAPKVAPSKTAPSKVSAPPPAAAPKPIRPARSDLEGRWRYDWRSMTQGPRFAALSKDDLEKAVASAQRVAGRSAVAFTADHRQVTTFFGRRTEFAYGYYNAPNGPRVTIKLPDGTREETLELSHEPDGRWVLRRGDGTVRLYRE